MAKHYIFVPLSATLMLHSHMFNNCIFYTFFQRRAVQCGRQNAAFGQGRANYRHDSQAGCKPRTLAYHAAHPQGLSETTRDLQRAGLGRRCGMGNSRFTSELDVSECFANQACDSDTVKLMLNSATGTYSVLQDVVESCAWVQVMESTPIQSTPYHANHHPIVSHYEHNLQLVALYALAADERGIAGKDICDEMGSK